MFLRTQNYEFFPGKRADVSTDLESLLTDLEKETEPCKNEDYLTGYSGWTKGSPYHGPCIHHVLSFRQRENATLVVQIIATRNFVPPICSVMWFHSSTCKFQPLLSKVARLILP